MLCVFSIAAQNLVPNPGFEEADTCSSMGFGIEGPLYWHSANGTPDHLQSCLPYGAFNGLPMSFFTYQEPFDGASCTGVQTYHHQNIQTEYREWIQAQLLEPMLVGQTYYCSFRANAAFGGNYQYPRFWLASDKVGMLFTMEDRPWAVGDVYPAPPNHAHITYPHIIADTVGWTLVNGSFVADSAYQYLMIGQFFSNALTDTLHFAPEGDPWYWLPRGYTLVDAVCVSTNPNGCDIGQGVGEELAINPVLFPNPADDQLIIGQRAGEDAQVLDAVGRLMWYGKVKSDRWVLEVKSWARGAYVLRIMNNGKVEVHKFVLIE
ncbi:MAG: T9SS type A sorting domain-containing protein [Flavobacteriales bacterium]|nr:T9SS type A sorting domain-containing protein [Flavobacteriales bacterium]